RSVHEYVRKAEKPFCGLAGWPDEVIGSVESCYENLFPQPCRVDDGRCIYGSYGGGDWYYCHHASRFVSSGSPGWFRIRTPVLICRSSRLYWLGSWYKRHCISY